MLFPGADFDSLLVSAPANVRYLTGFTGSSGCVLVTPRQRFLFTDFRYETQAAREVSGFRVEIIAGNLLEGVGAFILRRRLKTGVLGYEGAALSQRDFSRLKRQLKGIRLLDAGAAVEELRQEKKPAEISRMRRAAAIADQALKRLGRSRVSGRSELEVAWMLEAAMREAGSEPLPFDVIVASGPQSALPHARPGRRIIRKGDLLMVDLGARWQGYVCDMTRTFAVGELAPPLRSVYDIVREAQERAVAAVLPGSLAATVDSAAREFIADAGFGDRFRHSTGHGVGLETHEGPSISPRSQTRLAPAMTITVEPAIYLKNRGGVRIEDTVLVGRRRPERLTTFPRELRFLR